MTYPTLAQVENADREQLARWYRFLPSAGHSAIDCDRQEFRKRMHSEQVIMDRICKRFKDMGGMTPEISKRIGWAL